jgi:predicted nucleotidyltransferase
VITSGPDIRGIVERIVALCDPHRIYVFGSHAKGIAHHGSDLDLLVVMPSPLPRAHRGRDVIASLTTFSGRVDLLFYTPRELEDDLRDPISFVSMIAATARLLYVHSRKAPSRV